MDTEPCPFGVSPVAARSVLPSSLRSPAVMLRSPLKSLVAPGETGGTGKKWPPWKVPSPLLVRTVIPLPEPVLSGVLERAMSLRAAEERCAITGSICARDTDDGGGMLIVVMG